MSETYVPAAASNVSPAPRGASLADVLELVLDKGVVIAGDIKINLLEIELLTIKLRLLIASVDKAKELGINWWESDPSLTGGPGKIESEDGNDGSATELQNRVTELESRIQGIEQSSSQG
jgi:hypothetical protein